MTEQRSKYLATPAAFAGQVYDSQLECDVAMALDLMRKAGRLDRVTRQVPFVLLPRVPGRRATKTRPAVPALHEVAYVADWVVVSGPWSAAVEAKGFATPVWWLKRRLMQDRYPWLPLVVIRDADDTVALVERALGG